ncbi:MAG: cytochrome c [Pseudomonadota bacterium]|nr:cytochrome c [Pseudomonadota bacterium]
MRAMKTLTLLGLICLSVPAGAAGDAAAGQQKATQICAACHGPTGNSENAQYPKLAGQYQDYLEHALKGYQNGDRKNPVMTGMAQPLTEQEIRDLAAFYASQKGLRVAR